MSTRGCVAIANPDGAGWTGVYNHWDSYPTGLGKALWAYLHQDGVSLDSFAETLLHYDDWRNFLAGGICPYCGKVGKGQPHSIRGDVAYPDIHTAGYPDPEALRHQHGKLTDKITSDAPDPLYIEWVYVVEPRKRTLTILAHQDDGKTNGEVRDGEEVLRKDGFWDYGHCAYRHVPVGTFSLDSSELDWEALEKKRQARPGGAAGHY